MKNQIIDLCATCCEVLGIVLVALAIYRGHKREKINEQLDIFRQKMCYKASGDYRGYFIYSFADTGYTPDAIKKLVEAYDSSMLRHYVEMDWNSINSRLAERYKTASRATCKTDIRHGKNALIAGSLLIICAALIHQVI